MTDFDLRSHNLRVSYQACGKHAWFQFRCARQALKDGNWDEFIEKRNSAWWWLQRAKETKDLWMVALLEHGMEEV